MLPSASASNDCMSSTKEALEDFELTDLMEKSELSRLKVNESFEPGRYPSTNFSHTCRFHSQYVTQISWSHFDTAPLPADGEVGFVEPFHKQGDLTSPETYWPVCMTSVLVKVL